MYKANGDFIKSRNLYEKFTDISGPTQTLNVDTVKKAQLTSTTNVQQLDNAGSVAIIGNNKNVSNVDSQAVNTAVNTAVNNIANITPNISNVVQSTISQIPNPYQSHRQNLKEIIHKLKNISRDDVFKNKNNIIAMLKSAVDDKIEKIRNINKNDTYKLFHNLISILQETDYMLNDLEKVTPRLQNIMKLLSNTSNTIY